VIESPTSDADEREPQDVRRRPAIVAVDDEPAVLAAVSRDLRRGFGERYRVMRAGSGAEGLELLKQIRARGEQVAMLVADQRMPGLSGTEYLVKARELVPEAKRVLLTAYADTEAAIQAINEVALDYYLLKPWDPPEEQLFPVVEDLLTTWEAGAALATAGVRVIGHRFSKDTHDVRDFLARNRVPARWLDVERDGEARELLGIVDADPERLPADDARAGRAPRDLRPPERRPLRPGDRRRRARRAGGSGVRGIRGTQDGDGRAGRAGRPGGAVEQDRELPGVPGWVERLGPGAARHRPGAPPGSRARDRAGGDRAES
jgi:CheY-like chemotaxis protein